VVVFLHFKNIFGGIQNEKAHFIYVYRGGDDYYIDSRNACGSFYVDGG
jgi:YHS domain-containing protein